MKKIITAPSSNPPPLSENCSGPEALQCQERKAVLYMLGVTVIIVVGQLFFKIGATHFLGVLWFIAGLLLYGLSLYISLIAYRLGRLSVLFPITALSFVGTAIAGVWLFSETIQPVNLIGLLLLLVGTTLIGTDRPKADRNHTTS